MKTFRPFYNKYIFFLTLSVSLALLSPRGVESSTLIQQKSIVELQIVAPWIYRAAKCALKAGVWICGIAGYVYLEEISLPDPKFYDDLTDYCKDVHDACGSEAAEDEENDYRTVYCSCLARDYSNTLEYCRALHERHHCPIQAASP